MSSPVYDPNYDPSPVNDAGQEVRIVQNNGNIFDKDKNIQNASRLMDNLQNSSDKVNMLARMENAKRFSEMYNLDYKTAYQSHDAIVMQMMPSMKASPEAFSGILQEAYKESWEMQKLDYVGGLIGAGDDSDFMAEEYARLRARTKDGEILSTILSDFSDEARGRLAETLLDAAVQAPQLVGRAREYFDLNYGGRSSGYWSKNTILQDLYNQDGNSINAAFPGAGFMMQNVSMLARTATSGGRYTHITHAGQMYRELREERERLGVELTPEQKQAEDEGIKLTSNIYGLFTQTGTMADIALTLSGGKIAAEAVKNMFKGTGKYIAKAAMTYGANIAESIGSEFLQGMTTQVGLHITRQLTGLEEDGHITRDQRREMYSLAADGAFMSGRISALTGAAGMGVGAVYGGIKRTRTLPKVSLSSDAEINLQNSVLAKRDYEREISATVFTNMMSDSDTKFTPIASSMATSGALNHEQLRTAHNLMTEVVKPRSGESLERVYGKYKALMRASMDQLGIERPSGIYATDRESFSYIENGDYAGRIGITFHSDESGDFVLVAYSGEKAKSFDSVNSLRYDLDQEHSGAGVTFTAANESPYDPYHPIMQRVNKNLQEFKLTRLREGVKTDWDALNLPSYMQELGKNYDSKGINLGFNAEMMKEVYGVTTEDFTMLTAYRTMDEVAAETAGTQPLPSPERKAINQLIYKLASDQMVNRAIENGYESTQTMVNEVIRDSNIPKSVKERMQDLLIKAGVYEPSAEEIAAYKKLPKDHSKRTIEQQRIARLNEREEISTLSAEEWADLNDMVLTNSYNAATVLDVEFAGQILHPDLAVQVAIGEVSEYHNIDNMTEAQVMNRTGRESMKNKLGTLQSLVYSFDNVGAELGGDTGVLYDLVVRQPRESAAEVVRNVQKEVDVYNQILAKQLQANQVELGKKTMEKFMYKWRTAKTVIDNVTLSNDEMVGIYMHMSSKDNVQHLNHGMKRELKGGGEETIPRSVLEKAYLQVSTDPVAMSVVSAMRPVLDDMRALMEGTLKILKADDKYKFGFEENYFPIHVVKSAHERFDSDFMIEGPDGSQVISTNKTMLKDRTSSYDEMLYLTSSFEDFQTSIDRGSRFAFQEQHFWRASRVLLDPDVQIAIETASGKAIYKAAVDGLQDMAGVNRTFKEVHPAVREAFSKLMGARSIKSLGLNPISAARAWSSVFGIMSYTDADVATEAMFMSRKDGKSVKETVLELSAAYKARYEGGLYPEFMNGRIQDDATYKSRQFKNAMFWMMKQVDADAAARAWMGGYLQVQKDLRDGNVSMLTRRATGINKNAILGMSPDDKMKLAIQVGDYTMNLTQPSQEAWTRSGLQRSGIAGMLLTQFGSSVNAMRQQAVHGIQVMQRTDIDSDIKAKMVGQIATALGLQVSCYVGIGLLGNLAYGQLNGDDPAEKAMKKTITDFLNNFGSLFGIGRVVSLRIKEASKSEQAAGKDYKVGLGISLPMPSLSDAENRQFINDVSKVTRYMDGRSTATEEEMRQTYLDIMITLADTTALFTKVGGLPTNQIKKGVDALENWSDNE